MPLAFITSVLPKKHIIGSMIKPKSVEMMLLAKFIFACIPIPSVGSWINAWLNKLITVTWQPVPMFRIRYPISWLRAKGCHS